LIEGLIAAILAAIMSFVKARLSPNGRSPHMLDMKSFSFDQLNTRGMDLTIYCPSCLGTTPGGSHELALHFGGTYTLDEFRQHAHCPLCGQVPGVQVNPTPRRH
jgi:hypothetical protein